MKERKVSIANVSFFSYFLFDVAGGKNKKPKKTQKNNNIQIVSREIPKRRVEIQNFLFSQRAAAEG